MVHLRSRDGSKTLGITLWESDEALRQSSDMARPMREGRTARASARRGAEDSEVIFDERP